MAWLIGKWFLALIGAFLLGLLVRWGAKRQAQNVARVTTDLPPMPRQDGEDWRARHDEAQQDLTLMRGQLEMLREENARHLARADQTGPSEARLRGLEAELRDLRAEHEQNLAKLDNAQKSREFVQSEYNDAAGKWGEKRQQMEEEAARLRAQLADMQAAINAQADKEPEPVSVMPDKDSDELARLQWRERILASRIRFLEARHDPWIDGHEMSMQNKLLREERDAQLFAQSQAAALSPPAPTDKDAAKDETLRLQWRNRYLGARIAHLETYFLEQKRFEDEKLAEELARTRDKLAAAENEMREAIGLKAHIAELEAEIAEKAEQDRQTAANRTPVPDQNLAELTEKTRWRNHYLEMRVAYLEGRVSQSERAALAATSLAAKSETLAARPVGEAPQNSPTMSDAAPPPARPSAPEPETVPQSVPETVAEARPIAYDSPRGDKADDLKMIAGIGPVNEAKLHALGIYHFAQIAEWSPGNVAWVESHLHFPGRVGREQWIDQAKQLARGQMTDAAMRYRRGETT